MTVDDRNVMQELQAAHEQYEDALVNNNVPVLDALFWDSPKVIRFGATENLYGSEAMREFRKNRPISGLAREVTRVEVHAFGRDAGATTVEFRRNVNGQVKAGRQSQFWIRFEEGWRVVSAHVSYLEEARP
ncbi:MAG TPA: oxalurate catabolism protein HpxZ [Chthoniobacterales bacterium]